MVMTLGGEQRVAEGRGSPSEGATESLAQLVPPPTPHPGVNGISEWTGKAGLATICLSSDTKTRLWRLGSLVCHSQGAG